jgi:Holliday junction DNA helicase RuvA
MINYLKGQVVEITKTTNNRIILILEVDRIGYEIQIPSRFARQLSENSEELKIFTHLVLREEATILYGFGTNAERDLFRHLIAVNGIGAQLAIALIDTLGLEELVGAIVTSNINTLAKTPGVGKKTAERIALELKTKLAQWRQVSGVTITVASVLPKNEILEDLEMTLLALGYTNEEIEQALSVLSQDSQLMKNPHVEDWIRSAISWLSN